MRKSLYISIDILFMVALLDIKNNLKNKNISLTALTALSMAIIAPIAMAIGNSSGAATYAGFAMPLIPIIGIIFILFASAPVLEYTKYISFAGGYYGLAELGFGRVVSKWVGVGNLVTELIGSGVLQSTFVPFVIITSVFSAFGILLPIWLYFILVIAIIGWGYFTTVRNIRLTTSFIISVVFAEIIITLGASLYTLFVLPRYDLTLAPFLISSSPTGIRGIMLGVILTGFLFFSGYGTGLSYSEEAKLPKKTIWRSIILAILISGIVGVIAMYTEAVAIGKTSISTLVSSLDPAVIAFEPHIGPIFMGIFIAIFVVGIMAVTTGLFGAAARLTYSLSRDNFFSGKIGKYCSELDPKHNNPVHAANVILPINIFSTLFAALLMIHIYGYLSGIFNVYFLAGSMFVAFWYVHHIIPDIAMMRALPRKFGQKLTKPWNFFVSIICPIAGAIILIYSFVEGYSALTEPYFGGLIFVLVSLAAIAVYVVIKYFKNTIGESFIDEKLENELKTYAKVEKDE